MTQDFEEQSPAGFDLDRILGIARRRYFQFLIPFFIGWVAVWGASWFLPPRYKSGTLILVEQQTMPKDYVTPNVSDDLQERLQSITQQILSRTRLLHIIDEFNLYSGSRDHLDQDGKVDRMRKDIDITLVRDGSDRVTAFNVYYSAAVPYTAQQVTSELTNLADQEEKVRVFKSQHMGDLPGQLGANLQILSGLQSQLQAENDALTTANQQHTYLQTLFDQYRALQASPKSADGAPLGLPAIDDELEKLKAELADLSSRYTDRHPDVRKLKEQIAKTENMRQQILADIKARSAAAQSGNSNAQSAASELINANGTPSPMAQIKSQLQVNELEISNRNHSITELKSKINDYQARLNEEPIREQQLADLTRGYDQSKAIYDDLLKKKNDSQMATDMELLQQGERFRVLDPPSLPSKPDFPNHLNFCGFGLGAGLALGVAIVGAFEMMDDRLYTEKEIKELISVPVISEIPVIINPSDEKSAKKQIWLGWATGAVVFVIILAGSAFSYLHG
jgi:polysaccharide biosynthesis transport protein